MRAAGTTATRVMVSSDVTAEDFPGHTNVLAVLQAYNDAEGLMPYSLLVEVMEALEALSDELALDAADNDGVTTALHNVITDLRRLHLIRMSASGTEVTTRGTERVAGWNGSFHARLDHAREMLASLDLLRD